MMTEKRFNYHIDEVGIYYYVCDTTKKSDDRIILEVNTKYDAIEVCNALNELNDENKILKKELEICKRDNKDLIEHISDISSQINVVVFSDHMRRYIPPKRDKEQ